MKNKRGSAVLWIFLIIFILAILIIGTYLMFFQMSESRAKEIIRKDFEKNPSIVCDRFFIGGDRCSQFLGCYTEGTFDKISKNLLIQLAKDINKGKSSAIDSYYLVNGKEIGEGCISEILNIPENVNVNIIGAEPYTNNPSDAGEYLITKDIGNFQYEKSVRVRADNYLSYVGFYNLKDSTKTATALILVFNSAETRQLYFEGREKSTWTNTYRMKVDETINGIDIYKSSPDVIDNKWRSGWVKDNYIVLMREPATSSNLFDAYLDRYS